MDKHIPFNKPYLTGLETKYIQDAVVSGKISGDGIFTQKCQYFFEKKYNFKKSWSFHNESHKIIVVSKRKPEFNT